MTLDEVRTFALSLPEATEEPHFEMTSFRVRGKIFVTAPPEGGRLHVFVDEPETRAVVAENPSVFAELWWGRKLCGVRVDLAAADPEAVRELVEDSWRRRAPRKLLALYDAELPARS